MEFENAVFALQIAWTVECYEQILRKSCVCQGVANQPKHKSDRNYSASLVFLRPPGATLKVNSLVFQILKILNPAKAEYSSQYLVEIKADICVLLVSSSNEWSAVWYHS